MTQNQFRTNNRKQRAVWNPKGKKTAAAMKTHSKENDRMAKKGEGKQRKEKTAPARSPLGLNTCSVDKTASHSAALTHKAHVRVPAVKKKRK
jgi:hypothetical protein